MERKRAITFEKAVASLVMNWNMISAKGTVIVPPAIPATAPTPNKMLITIIPKKSGTSISPYHITLNIGVQNNFVIRILIGNGLLKKSMGISGIYTVHV